jgi:HEAT repeat protein
MDSLGALFTQALSGDYEDKSGWQAVATLHKIGTREIFVRAAALCNSPEPLWRARGLDVLAQLGRSIENRKTNFADEVYVVVREVLTNEKDFLPLRSAITALGHLRDPRAIPLITPFMTHADARLRFDATFALGCFPDEPASVLALLCLMEDSDDAVRDWATFGLGVLGSTDSTEIRDALFRKLTDRNVDVREEAMAGLAKRHDLRVLPIVMNSLETKDDCSKAVEAARFLLDLTGEQGPFGSPELLELLRTRFTA